MRPSASHPSRCALLLASLALIFSSAGLSVSARVQESNLLSRLLFLVEASQEMLDQVPHGLEAPTSHVEAPLPLKDDGKKKERLSFAVDAGDPRKIFAPGFSLILSRPIVAKWKLDQLMHPRISRGPPRLA